MRALLWLCGLPLTAAPAVAQQFAGEEAWKTILEHGGVTFRYIYYVEANSQDDGIVMMLENTNGYPVAYQFTILFEAESGNAAHEAKGTLEAGERKTGDSENLFWIPFDDGRAIGAIRLRGYQITRIQGPDS